MVSWGVPANNGAVIRNYTVQWKSDTEDYSSAREADIDDPTTTSITLGDGDNGDLDAGTEYTVRVRAINAYDDDDTTTPNDGDGPWSSEQTGTPADVPAAPTVAAATETPPGVTAGHQQLTVDWVEAPEDNGADITSYTVQWKSGTQDYLASRQDTAPADATSYTIPA